MSHAKSPLISIIDDDVSILRSLERLLRSRDYRTESFVSAFDFLKYGCEPNCLLLDLNMPEITGLELQRRLREQNLDTPIVFLTGCGDIPKSVQAISAGAIDFLEKPFYEEDLLSAIFKALKKDSSLREEKAASLDLKRKVYSLTPREHEVLTYVISGLPNKAIAFEMRASEKTIKVHRGRVMRKLGVTSIVELVRFADTAGIEPAPVTA